MSNFCPVCGWSRQHQITGKALHCDHCKQEDKIADLRWAVKDLRGKMALMAIAKAKGEEK